MAVIQPPRVAHRLPEELRNLTVKYESLDRTDGSARFGFGETQALVSVSGPIEVRLANENASKATFEVLLRPLASVPGTESRSLAATIRSLLVPSLLLVQHPRTLIQLVIQSLSPSSFIPVKTSSNEVFSVGIIAAMINASTLALLNSAVPMRGVVCAVSVAHYLPPSSSNSHLILDPTDDHLHSSSASGCFAFLFASGTTSTANHGGEDTDIAEVWSNWQSMTGFDEQELLEAKNLAKAGAKAVWMKMKETLSSMEPSPSVIDDQSAEAEELKEHVEDEEEKMEI